MPGIVGAFRVTVETTSRIYRARLPGQETNSFDTQGPSNAISSANRSLNNSISSPGRSLPTRYPRQTGLYQSDIVDKQVSINPISSPEVSSNPIYSKDKSLAIRYPRQTRSQRSNPKSSQDMCLAIRYPRQTGLYQSDIIATYW